MLERLKKLRKILNRSMANKDINYKGLKQMVEKNSHLILLDVRSKQEYEEGHLPNSIQISVYDIEKKVECIIQDKLETIITYCSSGNRSKEAQEILEMMGYQNVYNLKGGLDTVDNREKIIHSYGLQKK